MLRRTNKMNLNNLVTGFLRKMIKTLNPILKRLLAWMVTSGYKLNIKGISLRRISPISARSLKAFMIELPMKNSSMCQNRAAIVLQMRLLIQINPNNLRITSLRRQNLRNKFMFPRRIESFGMKSSNLFQIKRRSTDLILL